MWKSCSINTAMGGERQSRDIDAKQAVNDIGTSAYTVNAEALAGTVRLSTRNAILERPRGVRPN